MVQSIWIELHQEMPRHPKTLDLAQALKMSRRETVGLLVDLWTWGLHCADEHGRLKGVTAEGIAMALDWPIRQARKLVDALAACGWIDGQEKDYRLHDWPDYTSKLSEKRKDAERKRKARRLMKEQDASEDNPENVPGQSADSPRKKAVNPRAYITQPNQTQPNPTNTLNKQDIVSTQHTLLTQGDSPEEDDVALCLSAEFVEKIREPVGNDSVILDDLRESYSAEEILKAIEYTAQKDGRSASYVRRVLEGWQEERQKKGALPLSPDRRSYDIDAFEASGAFDDFAKERLSDG